MRFDKNGILSLDVRCYADLKREGALLVQARRDMPAGRLQMGGYKIFLDGSPQGKTAWMSSPYEGATDGYAGYPIYSDEEVRRFMKLALDAPAQLLVHCNGDAAAQQMIDAYARAKEERPRAADIRPVMIHAQLLRRDQLHRLGELGIIASFFVAHTHRWGDVHQQNFGKQRADAISPANSAQHAGVVYTFHQDTPVLPPDMLYTTWCACNRITSNGVRLDQSERVTPLQALRAITISAAYQYFEEDVRGSIRPTKVADFVVLSRNPLKVPREEIADIRVVSTIKEDRVLYRAKDLSVEGLEDANQ